MEAVLGILISVLYAFGIMILFGATIFVHELGHFLVAKWCGLQIDAFAIGMGPPIFQKKVNGVVYKLCWLPIGGYVALPQMDATGTAYTPERGGEQTDDNRVLPDVSPLKRIAVAVAGAAMNVLFALLLATIIWRIGVYKSFEKDPFIVGDVRAGSLAEQAGLRPYDHIVEINGNPTPTIEKGIGEIALNREVELKVLRDGELHVLSTHTETNRMKILDIPGLTTFSDVVVGGLMEGFPAQAAGLRTGDKITKVNGENLYGRGHFMEIVREHKATELQLTVERYSLTGELKETAEMTLIPKFDKDTDRFLVGIQFLMEKEYPTPAEQLTYYASSVFRILRAFVTPKEFKQVVNMISGPVGIISAFWSFLHIGIPKAIWFTALINVNLAILNLLPIPILDGGHVSYAVLEIITGRKIKERVAMGLTQVFFVVLMCFIVFVSYKDIDREMIKYRLGQEYEAEAIAEKEAAREAAEKGATPATP